MGVDIGYANSSVKNIPLRCLSAVFILGLCAALFSSFNQALIGFTSIIAGLSVAFACLRLMACCTPKPAMLKCAPIIHTSIPHEAIHQWPHYTVLVPLFHESNVVKALIYALGQIDYPHDKLEILIICESIDPFTIAAARRYIKPPFRLVIVPEGIPQTKPRALNFALKTARGAFVTIYDAEDIPHPWQLKEAVRTFKSDKNLGAVQAPLDYMHVSQNWLTQQFALEYAALFHVWVPFMAQVGLPFPLGGTSNHIRRAALDSVGGWDSYNVTEDADISFRLAAHHWTLGFITLPTQEEVVNNFKAWHFQRSRWMKGYIQTWAVHMHKPFAPKGWAGVVRFFTLQLTLGLTLLNVFLHVPIMAILAISYLMHYIYTTEFSIPMPYLISICISYGMAILIGIIGAIRAGKPQLILASFMTPLYWLALFAPTMRAVWEFRYQPFLWHKTYHSGKTQPSLEPHTKAAVHYDLLE